MDWIKINNKKNNLPTDEGEYFVFTGSGGVNGIHIVYVKKDEAYGINFIKNHATHYKKVTFPEIPKQLIY